MVKAIACTFFCQIMLTGMLGAQTNRATITGTVRDSSGAVIPGVTASATEVDTGVATRAVTNGAGIYTLLNLAPGRYAVRFRKEGFKPVKEPNIALESTQVAQLNVRLEVGAVTQVVTVTTQTPLLDKETATIGTNMKGDIVTDLPLSIFNGGRFVENFAVALTPGYSPISSPYDAVVNGNQVFTKDYTVDGTSATAQIQGDSMETGPSMEAVEEVQAQTSGLDAQSGVTNGGVMAFTLKSGTNKFHGSAFLYGRNEVLDANTWDNNNSGIPRAKDRAWDYGGSLGGPIIKNRTFFFGAFELARSGNRAEPIGRTNMEKNTMEKLIADELKRIPRGPAGSAQNILRAVYEDLREHGLAKDPTQPPREAFLQAVEQARKNDPDFKPKLIDPE